MLTELLVAAGAVVAPTIVAGALAATHPPRWDLSLSVSASWGGLLALLLIATVPLIAELVTTGLLDWLVFLLALGYLLSQYLLPVLVAVSGYITATAVRSWRGALLFGTPAMAGPIWWTGLLAASWSGVTVPAVAGPLSWSTLDLVTVPTFCTALLLGQQRAHDSESRAHP